MKNKLRAVGFIPFMLFGILTCNFCVERLLVQKEMKRNEEIASIIVKKTEEQEKNIEHLLKNSFIAFGEYLTKVPNPNTQNLIDWKNKLGVTFIVIHDEKTGKIKVASKYYNTPESIAVFKNYSLFDRCPQRRGLITSSNNIQFNPIKLCVGCTQESFNKVQKNIIAWYKDARRLIQISISSSDFEESFYQNLKLDKDIKSISLLSPNGTVIMSTKYAPGNKISLTKNHQVITFKKSFKMHDKIVNCDLIDTHQSFEQYFYILITEFSKRDLNKQIIFTRLIFVIIAILALGIIYFMRKSSHQKELRRLALKKQAHQIHHDIASPLMALDWGINEMTRDKSIMEGDEAIQLKQSVEALKDIISDLRYLHDDHIQKGFELPTELIYPIIYSAFSSSRLLLNDRQKEKLVFKATKDWNLLVNINSAIFRRISLNLIKNAIESGGKVEISLERQGSNAIITIADTGKGIAANILKQMMLGRAVTHDKIGGRGLGFSYAKKIIEQLGGIIALESELNKGTKQIIKFPISANKPSWFVDKISLENIKTIVIVDDFAGIHKIWDEKLKDKNIKIIHIHNSIEFENYIAQNKEAKNILYLVDFSLEDMFSNGLILIKKSNLQNQSILVTSKYMEQFIKDESIKIGVKILPKEFMAFDVFA